MKEKMNSKSKGPGSIYVSPVDRAHGMIDYSDKFELQMRFLQGLPLPKKDVNRIVKTRVKIVESISS